jgi:hypothetical protein
MPANPRGEVRTAWHAKEVVRQIYDIDDPALAGAFVDQLAVDLADESCPPEIRSLAGTLRRWRDQIVAWHEARVTNGPTEAVNNLIKRVKRAGFGLRRFRHYRVRALLYAGRPNWSLLDHITPVTTRAAVAAASQRSRCQGILTGAERSDRYKATALTEIPGRVNAVRAAEADLELSVARALHWGATWAEIAATVGTTRQSAHQRYRQLRYNPATGTAWREPPLPL